MLLKASFLVKKKHLGLKHLDGFDLSELLLWKKQHLRMPVGHTGAHQYVRVFVCVCVRVFILTCLWTPTQ